MYTVSHLAGFEMKNSLPTMYEDVTSYFVDVIGFLNQYHWIFNWSVTHILVEDVFHNLPPDWLFALDPLSDKQLSELHKGNLEVHWPSSLKFFLNNCQKLRLPVINYTSDIPALDQQLKKGLSPKKEHEVVRLAALVNSECSKNNISFVLDIGSGLGYLCEILHFVYGYNFLGLETDPKRTARALERHRDFEKSLNIEISKNVAYSTCHVSPNSTDDVEKTLAEVCQHSCEKVCMVGLHACGDLSSSALHLFHKIHQFESLVLLPCCYHRMALRGDDVVSDGEEFINFPLSNALQEAQSVVEDRKDCKGSKFLRRPFLRLAAQRSSEAWEKENEHQQNERVMNTLAIACLYLLAHRENLTLRKKKRRGVRRTHWTSLETFLSDAIDRYEFVTPAGDAVPEEDNSSKLAKLLSIVKENESYTRHIKVILSLQAALQPVAESLVLADLIAKLWSYGYEDARLLRLTDQVLSPRGIALVACKSKGHVTETHNPSK